MQFSLDNFNPDGMTQAEIKEWIEFIGPGVRPRVAKQWFPGMDGQFQHARSVRNYLWNKLTAMDCRVEGKIQEALQYEAICNRIYATLPDNARW